MYPVYLNLAVWNKYVEVNHSSGNLDASDPDKKISRTIKQAGAIMEIPLIDHIILTSESYMSMADEGLL